MGSSTTLGRPLVSPGFHGLIGAIVLGYAQRPIQSIRSVRCLARRPTDASKVQQAAHAIRSHGIAVVI
jgi:hypothetical protein